LDGILRTPAITEAPERESELRARVASVELIERRPIAAGDQLDEVAVGWSRRCT